MQPGRHLRYRAPIISKTARTADTHENSNLDD
jgi:hypothetical protein